MSRTLTNIQLKNLTLIAFLVLFYSSFAQHCQYCSTSIVGIHPISGTSKQIINGLSIFVVNENGIQYNGLNSVVDPVPSDNKNIAKTVLFWQNDSTKSPSKNDSKHFNFAHNDYLFRAFWSHSSPKEKDKLYIRIEDRDGNKNGGKFKTQVIPVSQLKLKLLCGYDHAYFKSDDYAPLTLELEVEISRDTSKMIKIANGFRFEFDPSPLSNCPECKGCICKSLQVFNSLEQVIFERVFVEKTLEKNYHGVDSIQVADYNFDGYPDFKLFSGFSKINEFYVYVPARNKFEYEPLLSRLANLSFNNEKQIAQGTIFDTIPHVKKGKIYNERSFVNVYTLSGKNLINVMVTSQSWYNPWNGYYPPLDSNGVKRDHIDTAYYHYLGFELRNIDTKVLFADSKVMGDFKFSMEINLHGSKSRQYLDTYTQDFMVTRLSDEKLVYTSSIKLSKVTIDNPSICTERLEVADYNFDGYPDFRVCQYSPQYVYMVFDKDKNTFVEDPLLNQMDGIEFDFTNKIAKANKIITNFKKGGNTMNPNPDRTEEYHHYMLSGKGFNYVQEYITISTYKNNQQSYKKEANYYFYSQYKLTSVSETEFKKTLNPSSAKVYNVPPFIFKLDKNPIDVAIPSEKGAYAYQVEVLKAKNSNVIFSKTFHGNKLKSPFICSDSLQIADFNFDGYPDFRVCALGSNHNYYVYYKKKNTFIEEKRLSELVNVVFDYNKKLVTGNKNIVNYDMGVHTRTIKVSLSAEELSKHKSIDNNDVQQAEPVVVPNTTIPKRDSVVVVAPKKDSLINKQPEKQFIKQWKNYQFKLIFNPPDIKPSPVYGSYVKVLEVKDLKKDSLIYSRVMRGDKYKEKAICTDSLLIDDYNFDGYPDYVTCNDYEGKRFDYHLYDSKKNSFVKDNLLSGLINVQLYPDSFKLVGFRAAGSIMQDVWMIGKGFPSVKIFSKTIGEDLVERYKVNTYIYKEGRLIEVNTPIPYKVYSKIKDGYRFQLEFNPDDIKISSEVGSYVKRLRIYKIEPNKGEGKVFETSLFANELKETIEQRDSFEITHYNFDDIPDVKFNNSFIPGQSVYYLSAIDVNEDQVFYNEQNLSNLQQIKRFENRKKLSGVSNDKTDFNTVSFYGKYLDTMVVVKQNLNTLAITQTITYLNKLGKLQPIPNIKALEPKPKTKKEFGDYNFDGYEDFRTKKSENDERWDFFIYNSKKQSFELDPLLSKMTYTWFDFENMEFIGSVYTRIDDTSNHTDTYKYFKGKITLYMKKDCVHKSPFSESSNCVISELKDGKWVETFVYGAE